MKFQSEDSIYSYTSQQILQNTNRHRRSGSGRLSIDLVTPNSADRRNTTEGVLRPNPDGGIRRVSHSTLASGGFPGTDFAPTEVAETDTYNTNLDGHERRAIMQATKVFYFHNMDLKSGDVREITNNNITSNLYRFRGILRMCEDWRVGYKNKIWGGKFFLEFVSLARPKEYTRLTSVQVDKNITEYERGIGRLTPYNDKTDDQKLAFSLDELRWCLGVALEFFSPLKKAVRCCRRSCVGGVPTDDILASM